MSQVVIPDPDEPDGMPVAEFDLPETTHLDLIPRRYKALLTEDYGQVLNDAPIIVTVTDESGAFRWEPDLAGNSLDFWVEFLIGDRKSDEDQGVIYPDAESRMFGLLMLLARHYTQAYEDSHWPYLRQVMDENFLADGYEV